MKVFISWSGDRSKALASALKEFLPDVNNSIEAWMSEQDIGPGSRWNQELTQQLDSNSFGVICLTPENLTSPWVLFEAGALSKSMDDSRVVPYRLGLDAADVPNPLAQFQGVDAGKSGTRCLIGSLNDGCEIKLEPDRLNRQFLRVWPDLESVIARIPKSNVEAAIQRSERELLEEVLGIARELRASSVSSRPSKHTELTGQMRRRYSDEFTKYLWRAATDKEGKGDKIYKKLDVARKFFAAGDFEAFENEMAEIELDFTSDDSEHGIKLPL